MYMNEEKITRDKSKKSAKKEYREDERSTAKNSHSRKLKNESSTSRYIHEKIRYGKKDNSLALEEGKRQKKIKAQNRKAMYREAAASETIRRAGIRNEDENVGTDALDQTVGIASEGIIHAKFHVRKVKKSNYGNKIHARNKHLNEIQGADGPAAAGTAGENAVSDAVKEKRKKLMQREFAEASAKKQAKESANRFGDVRKKFTDKAEDLAGRMAETVKEYFEEHPGIILTASLLLIVFLVVSASLSSCSMVAGGVKSTTIATTFTAEDSDLVQVEENYVAIEAGIQNRIDHIESEYPGYDEYNYSCAEVSHNPFELAALLTVLYENYTPDQVQSMLETISEYQYQITTQSVTETRTRTETRTGSITVTNADGTTTSVPTSYEVEVEYEYKILNVTLTNNGISAAVNALNLTQDQMERYQILLETKGNKEDVFGENVYAAPGVSQEYEEYAVPGEYLTDQQFANMLNEARKYLGYPYVWGGSSPSTSFDCSGFVSYVINHCGNGWNYGRLTANGWKNVTARVNASDVQPGDLVFFQGTYNTAGASHVGIVVDPANKTMIHCGNPIQYASYDTPYWRAHAYCYGRLR